MGQEAVSSEKENQGQENQMSDLVAQLREEVVRLKSKNEQLRREVMRLRNEANQLGLLGYPRPLIIHPPTAPGPRC